MAMIALNIMPIAYISKGLRVDEIVKSRHKPDFLPEKIPLLETVAANVPGMIFQILQRQNGSIFIPYISSSCKYLYELEPEAVQADFQVLHKLIHPQDIKAFTESIAVCRTTLTPWHWEGRIVTPSGKLKWIQGTSQPELQEDGDFLWHGLVIDITGQKQAQEKLQESEARYKAILDAIPDLMFRISRDGEYLDLKSEGGNITLSGEEIVGKKFRRVIAE